MTEVSGGAQAVQNRKSMSSFGQPRRETDLPAIESTGRRLYAFQAMGFPIKVCILCSEEFELKPDKPGFANRCPECSAPEIADADTKRRMDAEERKTTSEANDARRAAMRDLLYRKDS